MMLRTFARITTISVANSTRAIPGTAAVREPALPNTDLVLPGNCRGRR
jgi:hypothetical protein